jgi:MFS family permease
MGIGGEYSAINSAIDEMIPAKHRGRIDIMVNGTYWLGAAAGALLSVVALQVFSPFLDWRICFVLGFALGTVILVVRRNVPESPRWLFIHGSKVFEALAIGAVLMILGGIAELAFGITAERRRLEGIAKPLTAAQTQEGGQPRLSAGEIEAVKASLLERFGIAGVGIAGDPERRIGMEHTGDLARRQLRPVGDHGHRRVDAPADPHSAAVADRNPSRPLGGVQHR